MEVKILGKPSFMKGTRKDMNFFVAFWSFEPNNPGKEKRWREAENTSLGSWVTFRSCGDVHYGWVFIGKSVLGNLYKNNARARTGEKKVFWMRFDTLNHRETWKD
jgi:hypothetical protein